MEAVANGVWTRWRAVRICIAGRQTGQGTSRILSDSVRSWDVGGSSLVIERSRNACNFVSTAVPFLLFNISNNKESIQQMSPLPLAWPMSTRLQFGRDVGKTLESFGLGSGLWGQGIMCERIECKRLTQ